MHKDDNKDDDDKNNNVLALPATHAHFIVIKHLL